MIHFPKISSSTWKRRGWFVQMTSNKSLLRKAFFTSCWWWRGQEWLMVGGIRSWIIAPLASRQAASLYRKPLPNISQRNHGFFLPCIALSSYGTYPIRILRGLRNSMRNKNWRRWSKISTIWIIENVIIRGKLSIMMASSRGEGGDWCDIYTPSEMGHNKVKSPFWIGSQRNLLRWSTSIEWNMLNN